MMRSTILLLSLMFTTFVTQAQVQAGLGTIEIMEPAGEEPPVPMDPDPVDEFTKGIDPSVIRSEEGLVIWPIPASGELNIYCAGGMEGNLPFEVVDMTGKVIIRGSIQGGQANMIEVEALRKGDHLLRVVDRFTVRSIAFQSAGN